MPQRPSVKQPKPLTSAPVDPQRLAAEAARPAGAPVLGDIQAEVSPEAAPLWNFVLTHAKALAAGVLAIIAVIVGVAAWHWYQESSAEKARLELGRIVATADPAARLQTLESFAADAPAGVYLAARMELAAAAVEAQNWDKAAAAYAAVAERDKGTPLAFVARLNQADVLLRQGKAADALALLESLLPEAPDDLKAALHEQIGEAAEAAGQPQKAVEAYKAALSALPPDAVAEAAYYQDRVSRLQ